MAKREEVILWHNPRCGNSRGTLQLLRERGIEPVVVGYLSDPPDRASLLQVATDSGVGLRGLARDKEPLFAELGLASADAATLLDAMLANPVLINRPVVIAPRGTRLCRPPETVLDLLGLSPRPRAAQVQSVRPSRA